MANVNATPNHYVIKSSLIMKNCITFFIFYISFSVFWSCNCVFVIYLVTLPESEVGLDVLLLYSPNSQPASMLDH